jgi:hypothetical protein
LAPPAGEPKKNRNLIIGAGIAAVLVLVIVIVAVTSGNDSTTETLGGSTTAASVSTTKPSTSTSTGPTTSAVPQTTSEPTLVITTPSTNEAVVTTAPPVATTIPADVQVVTDGTNSFTVGMPKVFNTETAPLDTQGIKFAHVSGSKDLNGYLKSDDVFGITILATTTDKVASPAAFLNLIKPSAGACSKKVTETITTSFGKTLVNRYDGCGTGGKFAKVIMSAGVSGQGAVLLAFAQAIGPSSGDLLTFAKVVFETVTPL